MKRKQWESRTVGELVTFSGGSQPPRSTFSFAPQDNYVRLIQIRDYKSDAFATYIPERLVQKVCTSDDVMIGRYGPPIFQILRGLEGAYNVALIKATPNEEVLKDYLYYFLQQEPLFRLIDRLSRRSSGQTGVDLDALRDYEFPLPSIEEQRRICLVLNAWDEVIERVRRLIVAELKRKRGLAQELLSGKKRFPEFAVNEWRRMKVSDLTTYTPRITPKPATPFTSMGIRSHGKGTFLKPDFDPSKIEMEELFRVKENDLIVNITFAWEGAIAIAGASDDGALVSHRFPTFEFKTDLAMAEFFRHVIVQKRFVQKLGLISPGGAGRNRVLSKRDFGKLEVLLPSIREQRRIAKVLNACDKEVGLLKRQFDALKRQKHGLMQKLLTGQVRVRTEDENKEELVSA